VLHGECDHLRGGLMLGLVDATAVAVLGTTNPRPVAAPAPRPALPGLGCAAGGLGLPCLLILEMQVTLGAERPARHQQPRLLGHHHVGVDDPEIHPGDPTRVQVVVLLDGDGGGDRQPQPPAIGQQARLRRGNPASSWPALRRLAASNQASA
jgi:hypothetical protein